LIATNFWGEAAFGLLAPIFSVFIVEGVRGGDLSVAGMAAGIYWGAKSIIQIFVARFLDKKSNERTNFAALFWGSVISALSALLYLWAETPLHIYAIQFIAAVGGALSVPAWYVMFEHHLDRLNEALEWSLNSSITFGLGIGLAGVIGGFLADRFGFEAVFVIAAAVGLLGAAIILPLRNALNKTEIS